MILVVVVAALAVGACGKKGPPLAPIVKTPAALADLAVRRSGDTVYIRYTVPTTNTDTTAPADLVAVEVYAYTAAKEVEGLTTRDLTLVSRTLVRKPLDPEKDSNAKAKSNPTKESKKPAPVKREEPGVDQGTVVTVTEVLTPETQQLTPIPKRLAKLERAQAPDVQTGSRLEPPAIAPSAAARLKRFYLAYTVNHRGQRGNPATRYAVSFDVQPPAPGVPRIEIKGLTAEISWAPPAGAAKPMQGAVADPQLIAGMPRGMLLPVLPLYNIYLVSRPPAGAAADASARPADFPLPLNLKPLTEPTFVDPQIEFGVERCYQVRTVNVAGAVEMQAAAAATVPAAPAAVAGGAVPASAESAPSPIACVVPVNTIPPPAPTSLAAVGSVGAISLIWTGVEAPDLAGYIVLRGQLPQGKLVELFDTPIRETTYRDTAVVPGTRYVYVVVAIDRAKPPLRSAASNRAEETAR